MMFGSMKYKAIMAPSTNKSDTYIHLHIETTNHGSICHLQVQTPDAKASERCPILPSTGDVGVISDATVVYIKVCLDLLVLSAANSFIILICCALSSALLTRLVYLVFSTAPRHGSNNPQYPHASPPTRHSSHAMDQCRDCDESYFVFHQ